MRYAVIKFTNFTSVLLLGLLLVLLPRTTNADIAPPTTMTFVSAEAKPYVSLVTPVQKTHNLVWKVQWSDGEKQTLWPCVYEDSRHCYWDAGTMGNNYGDSFVMSRQKVWYLDAYAL